MTEIEKALQYVRDNQTWSDADDASAYERVCNLHSPVSVVSPAICNEIHDIMEEYSAENDLPEGWWYEHYNEDEIFMLL